MTKNYLFKIVMAFVFALPVSINAQTVFDFEDLELPPEGYWNGSDLAGGFGNNDLFFINTYNTMYYSWNGFAYSNWTDVNTNSYENQYSTYAGEAYNGSEIFGLGYIFPLGPDENIPAVCRFSVPCLADELYVTNATWPALAIIEGSGFARAFTDGDYFKLIIEGYENGSSTGIVEFYLADYREGNTMLIDEWTWLDLSSLGIIDSLYFNLESTDAGEYGMNTPGYFCIEDLSYTPFVGLSQNNTIEPEIYPNPFNEIIRVNCTKITEIQIIDVNGRVVFLQKLDAESNTINLSNLSIGVYNLIITSDEAVFSEKIVKL